MQRRTAAPMVRQAPVKKTKKSRNGIEITCRYCESFTHAEAKYRMENGVRKCAQKGWISLETPICDEFKPSSIFYCQKHDHQLDLLACANRREKHFEGCVNCKQGKVIEKIIEREKELDHGISEIHPFDQKEGLAIP